MTPSERARRIKMVIMDVDGVLTDGGMYYGESGEELKKFNTRDGQGIALLHQVGIKTALMTGEQTEIVTRRARKLSIEEVHQGLRNKLPAVEELIAKCNFVLEEICFIGDDILDLPLFGKVGLAVAVADAMPELRERADYITRLKGGQGAVREVCELILAAKKERLGRR